MKKAILIIIVIIFTVSCSSTQTKENTIIKNYSLDSLDNLSVNIDNSKVLIVPSDSNNLVLEIKTNRDIAVKNTIEGETFTINATSPKKTKSFGFFQIQDKTSSIIKLPKSFTGTFSLKTSNGSVTANDLNSNLNINTSNGKIKIYNIKGSINALSSNSKLDIKSVSKDVNASTSNGSIKVDKITGFTSLKTSNGSIEGNHLGPIKSISTSNGSISITSKSLSSFSTIKSSNGSIDLSIDKLGGDNIISTSNGHITLHTQRGEINIDNLSSEQVKDNNKNILIHSTKVKVVTE